MHHGLAIRPCRHDPNLLPSLMAEQLVHPPPELHHDCMCMGSNPGKKFVKMIQQIKSKFETSTLRNCLYLHNSTSV